MVVVGFFFFKIRFSNERSTIFWSLYHEYKYLEEENDKMVPLQLSPKIESFYGFCSQAKNGVGGGVCMVFCDFCKVPIWTILL